MRYTNPLSHKHGLLADDLRQESKLLRLCEDLQDKILSPIEAPWSWHATEASLTAAEALAADWSSWPEFGPRDVWGRKQDHTWFAAEVEVPAEAAGKTLILRFTSEWHERLGSTDPQCLAYLDGAIAQAIDGNHNELVVARDAVPGTKRTLLVNAFTFFDRPLVGFKVEYLIRNERAEKLYYDLMTPLEVAMRLPQADARRHTVMNLVDEALRALDRRDAYTPEFEASLPAAEAVAARIYAIIDTEARPTISAVGHTHLDVGWRWRVRHTRDKTGRSFATVLNLMEEYPQFVFMYNQASLFDFLKADYPETWDRVGEKVKTGQFEIEGAMWVEPDANIVSGESLIRQIMRGRRFHIEEFGVTPTVVWLPDTFGYSANLPQIVEGSGLEYFVTSKVSWNDSDRHPYDTFVWRGIDGTTTKAQLITAQRLESEAIYTTYNSDLSAAEVMGAWKRYEPKAVNDEVLVCYGFGDGGGGPTRAMIERGTRLERGIPGAPKVKMEGIRPFFDRLSQKIDADPSRFPVWNGELYLQYHRATLTSVAKNKANNRKAERLMKELEFLSAMAILMVPGTTYPTEAINAFWEMIMINQFHDILPGTSIEEVFDDSDTEYDEMFSTLASGNGLWQTMARGVSGVEDGGLRVVNFTGQTRKDALVAFESALTPQTVALVQDGVARPLQPLVGAAGETRLAAPVSDVPSLGWASAELVSYDDPAKTSTGVSVSPDHLENDLIRVRFDGAGEITSVYDKTRDRELVAVGQTANRLIAFEDKPMEHDAWDIERYFEEQFWPLSDEPVAVEVVETGPYRVAIRQERQYHNSRVVQVVSLEQGARQVEFDTYVDWNERQTVLKACFPFDLNCSEIRSEIQFGHVTRATHRNTSWDRARYEASMHRWVDMSEADFGAALINDCKYGYDAVEQLVRLTLLRGPIEPYPEADVGEHRFRYALVAHDGVSDLSDVLLAAERFNNPIGVIGDTEIVGPSAGDASARFSFASVDKSNVTLETVKKAEASDALIMRVFEHANVRATVRITFGVPIKSVRRVNLMEEKAGPPLEITDNSVTLSLRPFEIATLLIEPAQ